MAPRKSGTLCCVIGCSNSRGNSPGTKFYRFPKVAYKMEQKIKWIEAIQQRIDMASYSPDFLKQFFGLYRGYPCMWDTTSPEYRDPSRKNEAMNDLLTKFREIHSEATLELVEDKICALATFYRRQREKWRRALARGASTKTDSQDSQWYLGEDWSLFDLPPKVKPAKKKVTTRPYISTSIEEVVDVKEPILSSFTEVKLETDHERISSLPSAWSETWSNSNSNNNNCIIKEEIEIVFKQEQQEEEQSPEGNGSSAAEDNFYGMESENSSETNPLMDVPTYVTPSSALCCTGEQPAPSTIAGVVVKKEDLERTSSSSLNNNISAVQAGYSEEPSPAPSRTDFTSNSVPQPAAEIPRQIPILNEDVLATDSSKLVARQQNPNRTLGEHVDLTLSSVRPDQIILAQRLINDVLCAAQMGGLNDSWTFPRWPSGSSSRTVVTIGGIYSFYLAKSSVEKRRYENMKVRERMRQSNIGDYEASSRKFYSK